MNDWLIFEKNGSVVTLTMNRPDIRNPLGEPEDVANAVVFLASNQSDYINGETLHVNGGMYMAWQNKFLN